MKQAFEDTIARIDSQPAPQRDLAHSVLLWILYLKRPLNLGELRPALAIEAKDTRLDPEGLPSLELLMSVCAGLVMIQVVGRLVVPCHKTVSEFLATSPPMWVQQHEEILATICLTYLSFDVFREGPGSVYYKEDYEERCVQHRLLRYSTLYWDEHFYPVQSAIIKVASRFLDDQILVKCAAQLGVGVRSASYRTIHTTALHVLADSGLDVLLFSYLKATHHLRQETVVRDICKADDLKRLPLTCATEQGNLPTCQILIETGGAPINGQHFSALLAASEQGHADVVRMLLDEKADVNAVPRGMYYHMLIYDWEQGKHKLIQTLSDNRMYINEHTAGVYFHRLLQCMLAGDNESLTQAFDMSPRFDDIKEGPRFDLTNSDPQHDAYEMHSWPTRYESCLQAASGRGHVEIVQMLLAGGADPNLPGSLGGNALYAAAEFRYIGHFRKPSDEYDPVEFDKYSKEKYTELARVLLAHGANPHASGGEYGNSL